MKITEITAEKKEIKVQRLAAYCRVSSNSEDQLHSFAAQLRYYTNYEKQHTDVKLVGIYSDEGLTGTSMKKRAEMNRLIMDCEKGKIDRVITKSVSRFARNTHDLLQTLRLLKSYGVTVFFEEQGIDTAQLNSELFLTFPGMIAQQESVTISENVRWGIQKVMEKGEYIPHVALYGFEISNGELANNEEQASIVRRIFDMYLSGIGTQKIADTLNEEGIPTVSGKSKWYRSTVSYIITIERYKGEALLQKRTRTDTLPYRRKINKGQKQKYLVENANISIIPRETYDKAQKLLAERQTDNPGKNKHIFSNYIFCSKCGRSFRKIVNRGKAYWMSSVTDASNCICKHTRIKESAIFDAFSMMRFKLADNRESLIDTTIQMIEKLQDNVGNGANDIREIDEKIAKLSAQNHVLAKLHNNGILPAAEFTKQSSEIAYKITELGNYSSKYALTELLLCGECGTPYRRCTWTSAGKKRIVWRCISRLDYGKKYCHNSPTIGEEELKRAVMNAIQTVAMKNSSLLQTLKTQIAMSIKCDHDEDKELEIKVRLEEINNEFQKVMSLVSVDDDNNDIIEQKLTALIIEKEALNKELEAYTSHDKSNSESRISDIIRLADILENQPLAFDDGLIR